MARLGRQSASLEISHEVGFARPTRFPEDPPEILNRYSCFLSASTFVKVVASQEKRGDVTVSRKKAHGFRVAKQFLAHCNRLRILLGEKNRRSAKDRSSHRPL